MREAISKSLNVVQNMRARNKMRDQIHEKKQLSLEMPRFSAMGSDKADPLSFKLADVVEFSGQGALGDVPFKSSECSLIDPKSQTYPNVDFFIWKPGQKKNELHAFVFEGRTTHHRSKF